MAVLDNKSIRGGLSGAFRYINNPDKTKPLQGLSAASAYICGDHSVERLYSVGHNGCSGNPELALQQFKACEMMYRQKKAGSREAGLADGKQPVIAEHFFLSFPTNENVSYQVQCEIADKLCASPVLKDFYAVSNRHWNTDNDHSHILVCNISKDGSRKLAMGNAKRNALRKELDRICVSYGLSIIDDPALRWKDPNREAFVRSVVEAGEVDVYAPADYGRRLNPENEYDKWALEQIASGRMLVTESVSKNRKCTQAEAYKRWIASQELFVREKNKKAVKRPKAVVISKADTRQPKAYRLYFWDTNYECSQQAGHYYAVLRYDESGRHKTLFELITELMFVVAKQERQFYKVKYPKADVMHTSTNKELQRNYDVLHLQQEYGIRTPAELDEMLQAAGSDLSEVRQGLSYYKKTVENGTDLFNAILTYNTMKRKESLTEDERMIGNEAYRIMASFKCTMPVQMGEFINRRRFAEKKVEGLTKQEKELRKRYHDLKFIKSHADQARAAVAHYTFHNAGKHSLDEMINHAKPTSEGLTKKSENLQKKSLTY